MKILFDKKMKILKSSGKSLKISNAECEILLLLAAKDYVNVKELIDKGWGGICVGENSLLVAISNLRCAFRYFENIRNKSKNHIFLSNIDGVEVYSSPSLTIKFYNPNTSQYTLILY
jgi:hypothetical protein